MIHNLYKSKFSQNLTVSLIVGLSSVTTVHATDALSVNLQAKQVVNENGKQVLKPVARAKRGDVIQYQATYRNNLQKPMTDVALTIPVPTSMIYVNASSQPPVQATLDGKNFENLPIMRKVNGKLVEVPASQYRGVRWIVKTLPAQQSATVSINTKVQ